ncbi:MAG: response regulator transcription factor [Burkholderiaceae bacterium]
MASLLLVEDDPLLGGGLHAALEHAGYRVDWVRDGQHALERVRAGAYAALLLDIGLPGLSGLEVLTRMRAEGRSLPVLILTARDATRDKVAGLEAGADDYVVKTADLEELIARVRALLRRAGLAGGTMAVGDVVLDLDRRSVQLRGTPVAVSRREFDVLHALMSAAGRVLTRSQLEEALYGWSHQVESNTIEVHVHNLRHKLGSDVLKTVRGVGYTMPRPLP